ncbi:ABC transporter substrate-binding protein [Actinoplanes subtropicus]|uniref:ABC transporter substrate-binding protein n=1 Tax=Actinoplanes subtropicus TaxID=543632 RepID=UPI00068C3E11|nr:hypothetical protein [Actinoplanes subtropicus]
MAGLARLEDSPVTLRMSYFVPPAPLVEARARGALDGFDLEEVRTSGSPAQLAGLLDGTLDLVVTAIDNLFEWVRAGADVRLVGQVERTTRLGVFADESVEYLTGLSGQPFAVDAFTNGFALVARRLLAEAGVEVRWIEVGGVAERLDGLLSGAVTATLLGPPFDGQARRAGKREILTVQQAFPAFPGQGLVARTDLLGNPELDDLLDGLGAAGLLPVDPQGLAVLTDIRDSLGLLPPGVVLGDLVA